MKNSILKIALLAFVMVAFGCSDTSKKEVAGQTAVKKHFDLETYFEAEVGRLAGRTNLKKTSLVNGQREEQQVEKIDFKNELVVFSNSDINRPAWSDQYAIDSTFNERKELTVLTYRATDEKLRTREISINFDGGEVSKIQIENATVSAVADNRQSLLYEPSKGYSIESRQRVKTVDDVVLRIEVQF